MAKSKNTPSFSITPLGLMLGIFFSFTLALSLFAAGFALCTLPGTTNLLSRLFSDFETSAYLPADTTNLAVATRNFTVDPYSDGQDSALETLALAFEEAAQHATESGSLKAQLWANINMPQEESATKNMYALAEQGSKFALGPLEIQHLVDCNKLIRIAIPVLVVIAVIALVSGIMLATSRGRKSVGIALIAAPALLLLAMIALSIWALLDFNGFFVAFHALLFPQGNWTFPQESILICMLPTSFWIGMAAIWAFTTITLSVFSLVSGKMLCRNYS